jgi:hypothetical protein
MRATGSFQKLLSITSRRLLRLKAIAQSCIPLGLGNPPTDRVLSFVVIEAQNLWGNFVRSYLLSLLSRPRRQDGTRVVLGNTLIRTSSDLIFLATQVAKGPHATLPTTRREEPAWHDVNVLIKTCTALRPSHLNDIHAALSITAGVLSDLPTFRNFYAHRNEESAHKAIQLAQRQYLILGTNHPTEALSLPAHNRPQALVFDWLDELLVIVQLLCH